MILPPVSRSEWLVGDVIARAAAAVIAWLERFLASPRWILKATALATGISLLHAFPAYDLVDPDHANWQALVLQADDPFEPHDYPPESHAAKLALRLTTPMVGYVLGLGVTGFIVYNAIAGIVLLALVTYVAHSITGDRVVATLTSVAVGLALVGSLGFTATNGNIDAPALALLVAALALRNPIAITPVVVLACFTDERALLGSALVLLFHVVRTRSWVTLQTAAVAAGVVGYLVLRFVVTEATGLETPRGGIGVGVILDQYVGGPLAAWSAFAALWALVLAGLVMLWLRQRRLEVLVFAGLVGATLFAAMIVGDTARSMTYAVPAVLIALAALAGQRLAALRLLLLGICAVSLLPNYYVDQRKAETHAYMQLPAPLQAIRATALE